MKKLARFVVRCRVMILILAVLLLIPSVLGALLTRINYDILSYLPPELDSMLGERVLENDFHIAATGMVTIEGLSAEETAKMEAEIAAVPGVRQVFRLADVIGDTVPAAALPEDLQKFFYGTNDAQMMLVRFEDAAASDATMNACGQIEKLLRKGVFFGGLSMIFENTKNLINSEMPWYVVCAVGASLLVLFLSVEYTIVPFLFMAGLVFPILYNFGTNIFFGEISYITEALATVLQLGVTMDFSIFLLSRYQEEKKRVPDIREAMTNAIANTTTAISASSLTTIAGFLALCTMELTLGKDIGLVMAKGVFLGVLCTVTVLPALLLTFDSAIEKHRHRTLIPELHRGTGFVTRHALPVLLAFTALFIPFALAQSRTDVYYTLFDSLPQDLTGLAGTHKLNEDFGMVTNHFILVDDSMTHGEMRSLEKELEGVEGVTQVVGIDKFLGAAIPEDILPDEIREIFSAGGYRLIIANSEYETGAEPMSAQLNTMTALIKKYDPNAYLTGEGAMTKDLIEIADVDFHNVNYASIAAVFLIIAISFRSLSIPILLVAAIESAIYINLGIPYFTGTVLPFIASIVIGTIQLGATVDYAILMTTRFREELQNGHDAKAAARIASEASSRSILTSGLSFFAATFGVSLVSRMELLQSLCLLISRGAVISMFVIIFILPCLLILTAPVIRRTTYRWLG